MKINIDIDDDLMAKAKMLGGNKTKKSIVERALKLFIAIETQKGIINLWGKVRMDDKFFGI